ncbi:hypothetical protein ACFYY5_29280 [Nocardia elegans]|uniref:Uncharacterized protein n=1 Tax=Nocardia elegans TaxID=300029 RepID=A0ABW6TPS0_9NOCA
MSPVDVRELVVDRLNFLVGRELAEELATLLANQDFVGGDLLPADVDYQTNMAIRDGERVPVVSRRYVTHYREIQR